ncbi:DUF412 domain-containing protein [Shewanella maritima]|uniref:UPF0208 membrane protein YfbV n=2 Tax=Shewanella maritima TaxID=2520507 RepID=A0A411PLG9_9GAMM|nr:DUF412 domain-containing protein [Shewanella maritima]
MKVWPMVKQLSWFFPEYRVIKATRLALFVMPAIALATLVMQVGVLGWAHLPQAIAMGLFFISLPIQGYIWLGWRAQHPLPLTLFDWSNQLSQKLSSMGVNCQPLTAKACYLDMAYILKLAFERLDKSYWDEL